ncbi:MAG: ABC transporter permease [Spirochaetales bacterium]|nr:ABC transporter permease [Spirochaetales bacterium]
MLKYTFKRILGVIPVLMGVTFLVFTMLHLTPGDPARIILGEQASLESVQGLRDQMGLNDNFFLQFFRYCGNAVTGDLGRSYSTNRPVFSELLSAFPYTLQLATMSIAIALLLGIPFGIISSIRQYSLFDNIVTSLAMVGISIPVFWSGLLLILLFSVHLRILPPSGGSGFISMIMPAATLAAQSVAVITRMTRSSMLEIVRQDFVRTARSKGANERHVIVRHALPNALVPVITITGIQFGRLLGGAVLTEIVFSIPGVGRLLVSAIQMRDYPMVQGGVLFIAVAFCLVNLGVDLLYAYLDPRIKSQYK